MSAPTMSAADRLAHEAGSYVRPSFSADVHRAVVRYEIASATVDRLSAMDARDMSGAQFTSLAQAQDEMATRRAFLAAAGMLHLIEVAA